MLRFGILVALLFLHDAFVSATSTPGKRLAHPVSHVIDILPRPQPIRRSHHTPALASSLFDSSTLQHFDSFRLTLSAFDETFHLHLRPNDDLVHPSASIVYHDGRSHPLLRNSVRAYWGEVVAPHASAQRLRQDAARLVRHELEGAELGWARILVHGYGDVGSVFEGAFSVNGNVHHITTRENYLRHADGSSLVDADSPLVIWRESDVSEESAGPAAGRTCAHDDLEYNSDPYVNPMLRLDNVYSRINPLLGLLDKRDGDFPTGGFGTNFIDTIGQTAGCPQDSRVVYMGVAADCEFTRAYGSEEAATQQILNIWNTASALYKRTFNVSLGIVELQVQPPTCPTTANASAPWNVVCGASGVDLSERLKRFSAWRGARGADGAGLWHLLSACASGSEVGIAWLGTLCQQDAVEVRGDSVSGTGVSTIARGGRTWQVVAHEIGHNFGAIHDCTDGCSLSSACCPLSSTTCDANSQFVMDPVSQPNEDNFSPCSLGNICSLLGSRSMNTTCLVPPSPGTATISLNQCGNGIVEDGEECDPGAGANSTCCDAATCRFTAGAVCDYASAACCTNQCQFAGAGTLCRAVRDEECDVAEVCDGVRGSCPTDEFAPNGRSCGAAGAGLQCAAGTCTSLDMQCRAQGASLNLTRACTMGGGDSSCRVSCENPGGGGCLVLDVPLLDGSPCGYGGTCSDGRCDSGSALDTFSALYRDNLRYSIPITIIVGIIVIAILLCLVRCCCTRSDKRPMRVGIAPDRRGRGSVFRRSALGGPPPSGAFAAAPPGTHMSAPSYQNYQPPQGVWRQSGWVDDARFNGPRGFNGPQG